MIVNECVYRKTKPPCFPSASAFIFLALCLAASASLFLALPQADVARPVALAPGGRPVGVGLAALPALFDLLHLPYDQILEPGLELEGLGISSIIIPVITSKLQAAGYFIKIYRALCYQAGRYSAVFINSITSSSVGRSVLAPGVIMFSAATAAANLTASFVEYPLDFAWTNPAV